MLQHVIFFVVLIMLSQPHVGNNKQTHKIIAEYLPNGQTVDSLVVLVAFSSVVRDHRDTYQSTFHICQSGLKRFKALLPRS